LYPIDEDEVFRVHWAKALFTLLAAAGNNLFPAAVFVVVVKEVVSFRSVNFNGLHGAVSQRTVISTVTLLYNTREDDSELLDRTPSTNFDMLFIFS
jgi:hypothetical protein